MKITITQEIEVRDSETQGAHEYLVAEAWGGIMEDPEIHYEKHQVIRANSEQEAEEKYNRLNDCSYYYGTVLRRLG